MANMPRPRQTDPMLPDPLTLIAPAVERSTPSNSTITGSSQSSVEKSNMVRRNGMANSESTARPTPPQVMFCGLFKSSRNSRQTQVIVDPNAEWARFLADARSSRAKKDAKSKVQRQATAIDLTASFLMGQASDALSMRTSQMAIGGLRAQDADRTNTRDEFLSFVERQDSDRRRKAARWKRWLGMKILFYRRSAVKPNTSPDERAKPGHDRNRGAPTQRPVVGEERPNLSSVVKLSMEELEAEELVDEDFDSDQVSIGSSVEVVELLDVGGAWDGRTLDMPTLEQLAI